MGWTGNLPSLYKTATAQVYMKKVKDLLTEWAATPGTRLTAQEYAVHLPIRDASRLEVLAGMYPGIGICGIITDLISASLDELESTMPYVEGNRVIEEDEFGDPIYKDAGPSARFHQLARVRAEGLQAQFTGNRRTSRKQGVPATADRLIEP